MARLPAGQAPPLTQCGGRRRPHQASATSSRRTATCERDPARPDSDEGEEVIDDRRRRPRSPRRAPPPSVVHSLVELTPEREKTASIRDSAALEQALAGAVEETLAGVGPWRRGYGWCRVSSASGLGAAPRRPARGAASSGHGRRARRGRGGHRRAPPWLGSRPWRGGEDSQMNSFFATSALTSGRHLPVSVSIRDQFGISAHCEQLQKMSWFYAIQT
jgi:hypothetical protein